MLRRLSRFHSVAEIECLVISVRFSKRASTAMPIKILPLTILASAKERASYDIFPARRFYFTFYLPREMQADNFTWCMSVALFAIGLHTVSPAMIVLYARLGKVNDARRQSPRDIALSPVFSFSVFVVNASPLAAGRFSPRFSPLSIYTTRMRREY